MRHERYLKFFQIAILLYPISYSFLILLISPLAFGIIFNSISAIFVSIIFHIYFLYRVPAYLMFWRKLSYGFRILFTILLHRYLFHLSQSAGINTVYADISDVQLIEDFYKKKKRSIRRRMTKSIPEKVARAGIGIKTISSHKISVEHLRVQYAHSKKHYSSIVSIIHIVLIFFSLAGNVTEYRIRGKLVGQGISFLRGESYTVFMFGCIDEASRMGLWFLNIIKGMEHAISMKALFLNGTIENHSPEAKSNAGFDVTIDEDLVFRLYGGKFSNLPKGF